MNDGECEYIQNYPDHKPLDRVFTFLLGNGGAYESDEDCGDNDDSVSDHRRFSPKLINQFLKGGLH